MTDDDKTLLTLIVRDAVRAGMDDHISGCHARYEAAHLKTHDDLNGKVDETRRFMWFSGGVAAMIGGVIGKALGK